MQARKHTVRPGESLSAISRRELGSERLWPQLFAFNAAPSKHRAAPLKDPNRLSVGQSLAIPPRVSSRPPHLVRHPDLRHPMQQTHPKFASTTAPAQPAVPQSGLPPPPQVTVPPSASSPGKPGINLVNSPAFKFDLDLAPPIKRRTPAFDYEVKFQGQIILWTDQQVDILTITNKGFESAAKAQIGDKLTGLLTSEKVKFDPAAKKVSFESMLTNGGAGHPLAEIQVGIVVDTSDPRPAYRLKLSGTDKLMGRIPPGTLWVAEKLEITVDVRLNAPATGGQAVLSGVSGADSQNTRLAGITPADSSGFNADAAGQPPRDWTKSPWARLFAVLIVAGVLATNVMTWGMRAPLTGGGTLVLPGGPGRQES